MTRLFVQLVADALALLFLGLLPHASWLAGLGGFLFLLSEFVQSTWLIWQLAETCLLYGTFAVMTSHIPVGSQVAGGKMFDLLN